MTQIFESKIRSRLGVYRLKVHDTTDTITTQREVPIRGALKLRVASPQPGYGPHVLSSFAQVEFDDRGGALRSVFSGGYAETDYLVEIEGPSFLWRGCVRQGRRKRSTAPRVKPGRTRLYLYDRLAALRDEEGTGSTQISDVLVNAFQAANPHVDAYAHFDVQADNQHSSSPEDFFLTERLGPDRRGDFGSAREQLETVAAFFGLRVYMSCRDGHFYALHRPSVGEKIEGAWRRQFDPGDTWEEVTIEADQVTIPAGEIDAESPDEGFQELRPARGVQTRGVPRPLVRDGRFQYFDNTTPILWDSTGNTDQGADGYVQLGFISGGQEASGEVAQRLLRVSDVDGVRLKVAYDALAGTPGDSTFELQVILHGESGTDYWMTEFSWSQTEEGYANFGNGLVEEAGQDFPENGIIELVAEGVDAEFGEVSADLVDEDGEPIDDWSLVIRSDVEDGDLVDIGEALVVEVSPDGTTTRQPASEWEGRFGTHARLIEHTAAGRLAQQDEGLETLEAGALPGLYGPEKRILVRKPNESSESAFICAGRILDITAGQTEILDVELPAEVLS